MKELPLTRGKVALVDDEDLPKIHNLGKWQAVNPDSDLWYARTTFYKKAILLHRFLMGVHNERYGFRVDHIDFNGLNCQKENLRVIPHHMNLHHTRRLPVHNSSGYKGVSWSNRKQKWCAEIRWNCVRYHLGFFDSVETAALAYQTKRNQLWQSSLSLL